MATEFNNGNKLGRGRPRGALNKATQEFRHTVQALLDDNRANVAVWLKAVAEGDAKAEVKPDPGKALDLLAKLAEFAAPKLGRTEHVGKDGGPIEIVSKEQRDAAVLAALRADA